MRVWSVPMRTRFRGITVREGVLLTGAGGWGEWSPFLEYDAATSAPWRRNSSTTVGDVAARTRLACWSSRVRKRS